MSYGYRQYRDTAHRWTQIGVGLISVIAGLILIVCVTAPMYVSSMLKDAGLSALYRTVLWILFLITWG